MRKQPTEPPEIVQREEQNTRITQKREYKLITPLFGGGALPGEIDPVTPIRGTEIRGHLRFWWRACKAGKFNDVAAMKEEEDAIWGKAHRKEKGKETEKETTSQEQKGALQKSVVQIVIEPLGIARKIEVFQVQEDKQGKKQSKYNRKEASGIPEYAAFPLQHSDEELAQEDPPRKQVYVDVQFRLTISFPKDIKDDIEAAFWAWETFGGIGARTRRGFGALHLQKINDKPPSHPRTSRLEDVRDWIQQRLRNDKIVVSGNAPSGVPHISSTTPFVVTFAKNTPPDAWEELISLLKRFRQAKDKNRSVWPEAKAIREIIQRSSTALKFPRAAFGLPIIFHFKNDVPPQTTLKESSKEGEGEKTRFASPLILRPLLCSDDKAVGLALLLEGSRVMLEQLELVEQASQQKHTVQGKLKASDTKTIHVLENETDVLKAFMNFLKLGGKSPRERRRY